MYINAETVSERLRSYSYQMADLGFLKSSRNTLKYSKNLFHYPVLPDRNLIQLEFSSVHTLYGKICVNEKHLVKYRGAR